MRNLTVIFSLISFLMIFSSCDEDRCGGTYGYECDEWPDYPDNYGPPSFVDGCDYVHGNAQVGEYLWRIMLENGTIVYGENRNDAWALNSRISGGDGYWLQVCYTWDGGTAWYISDNGDFINSKKADPNDSTHLENTLTFIVGEDDTINVPCTVEAIESLFNAENRKAEAK